MSTTEPAASASSDPLSLPLSEVLLISTNTPEIPSILRQIVELHIACSENDGTIATFLPPWDREEMYRWYEKHYEQVSSGSREILLLFLEDEDRATRLAGVVMLAKPFTYTGPFRGSVEKLFVSPDFRRRGIAKKLLTKLEQVAKEAGRIQLFLDTEAGSAAESVYPRLGYTEYGRIPHYAISPKDGSMANGVFFYKLLK